MVEASLGLRSVGGYTVGYICWLRFSCSCWMLAEVRNEEKNPVLWSFSPLHFANIITVADALQPRAHAQI